MCILRVIHKTNLLQIDSIKGSFPHCFIIYDNRNMYIYVEMVCWEDIPISFHLVSLVLTALVFVLTSKFMFNVSKCIDVRFSTIDKGLNYLP